MRVLRSVGAVIAGLILAALVVAAVEAVASKIYPLPAGVDPHSRDALKVSMAHAPVGALVMVLIAWAAATISGAWLAAKLAGRAQPTHGLIVGVILLIAGIANMLMLPHPLWMWVAGILMFLVGGYVGGKLART